MKQARSAILIMTTAHKVPMRVKQTTQGTSHLVLALAIGGVGALNGADAERTEFKQP
jgi:hypothetical protein